MNILAIILSAIVAAEHLYIMYLETFATRSSTTARVFSMTRDELERESVATLFRNQGVYNGLLAVLIIIALVVNDLLFLRLLLGYVIAVALYGSLTSSPSIILKQGLPALLALLATFF